MGFDIVHFNLHKTFSQPHGGGGPGGGPIAVRDSARAVPAGAGGRRATATRSGSTTTGRSRSARCAAFTGPFGVFVRSYAYIRAYGPALREMSRGRRAERELPARAAARRVRPAVRPALHARVRALARARLKREHGVTALDVAKRLMDYGFHPPTIYFPLVVARGADDRADRDRGEGDARRLRRRDARDRARGGGGARAAEGGAARRGPCAGSTR